MVENNLLLSSINFVLANNYRPSTIFYAFDLNILNYSFFRKLGSLVLIFII
jgi:hypothetical protein